MPCQTWQANATTASVSERGVSLEYASWIFHFSDQGREPEAGKPVLSD